MEILKTKVEVLELPSRSTSNDSTQEIKLEARIENKTEIKVVRDGIVEKKSPWFHYNSRRILLYNTGKLEYIDPEKNLLKGTIYLSYECKCICDGDSKFELITPKRTFIFKVINNVIKTDKKDSKQWASAINDIIPKKR